jgi:hypothetical protein
VPEDSADLAGEPGEQVVAMAPAATAVTVKAAAATGVGSMGAAGGALAAAGLAAGGGGGGGGSSGTSATSNASSVTARPLAGPFVSDNQVEVFDLNGKSLATGRLSDGKVTLGLPDGYSGMVMIRIIPSGTNEDYRDETTRQNSKLEAEFGLRAFVLIAPGVNNQATVSPLTELAVRQLLDGQATPTVEKPVNVDEAKAANQRVGQLVGLTDITGSAEVMVKADGTLNTAFTGDSSNQAQLYGKILAQLSGLASGSTTLEEVLDAMTRLVGDFKAAVESKDPVAQDKAQAGILDQLSVGAKQVAAALGTSEGTVKNQRKAVYKKLGIIRATQLAGAMGYSKAR